jgi:hypothetical protein
VAQKENNGSCAVRIRLFPLPWHDEGKAIPWLCYGQATGLCTYRNKNIVIRQATSVGFRGEGDEGGRAFLSGVPRNLRSECKCPAHIPPVGKLHFFMQEHTYKSIRYIPYTDHLWAPNFLWIPSSLLLVSMEKKMINSPSCYVDRSFFSLMKRCRCTRFPQLESARYAVNLFPDQTCGGDGLVVCLFTNSSN